MRIAEDLVRWLVGGTADVVARTTTMLPEGYQKTHGGNVFSTFENWLGSFPAVTATSLNILGFRW